MGNLYRPRGLAALPTSTLLSGPHLLDEGPIAYRGTLDGRVFRAPRVAAPLPGGGRAPGPRTARLVASVTAGWRLTPMTCSDRTVILKWTGPW